MKGSVLVTGGAGYIGSVCALLLEDQGFSVSVIDNLSTGHRALVRTPFFFQGDIGDPVFLKTVFEKKKFDAVFHFAAKSIVSESVQLPKLYEENNVKKTAVFLNTCAKNEVPIFIFSSSCAVYGNPISTPISETHPLNPIHPYGITKLQAETLIQTWAKKHQRKAILFRYFNASGADPYLRSGEWHQPETHLIPNLFRALDKNVPFSIYGNHYPTPDGTCIRDFISVLDVATAHIQGFQWLQSVSAPFCDYFNIGSETGYSVLEVLKTTEKIIGKKIPYRFCAPRPKDPPILIAEAKKIKKTFARSFHPQPLPAVIESAWKWHLKKLPPQTHAEPCS